jgi:Holliday junction resolvasome RuvABC endonuclease subunit
MTNLVQRHHTNRPILALAPGLQTGWAFTPGPGIILSGSWDLSPGRGDEALRYQVLRNTLDVFWFQHGGDNFEVLYEQVHRHAGTQAAHIYGGIRSVVLVWCMEHGIKAQPVGVGQIKKFWTGKGNATKEDMVTEARARGFDLLDDNEATALALLHYRIVEGPTNEALAA